MFDYRAARTQGMSQADAIKGIQAVGVEFWPRRDDRGLWVYLCHQCKDTGWETQMVQTEYYEYPSPKIHPCPRCAKGQKLKAGHEGQGTTDANTADRVARSWT